METLTVVNRTDKEIVGTWNGRQYTIKPLETQVFAENIARAIKRQNPVMGSGDPRDSEYGMTGRMKYKVGLKELNDPCDPLGKFEEGPERWDRNKLVGAKPSELVAGDNGIYSARDVAVKLPGVGGAFQKD